MTDLNNEVRELTIDELDSVSGGFNLITTLKIIVANYNFEQHVQDLKAKGVGAIQTTLN